jgi:carboxymethylenebutenolidase
MPDVSIGAVTGGSSALTGYLAVPEGTGPWPGVVSIHEAWGLDPVMRRIADRLARMGYLTFAPDLYSDGGARRCMVSTMRAMTRGGDSKALADIDAAQSWLRARGDCTGKVGVIGFCMGGGFALLSAPRGFDAAAVNYGILPRHRDSALEGACPIVANYGRRDIANLGAAGKLSATLERLGVEHDVKQYPSAGHSFLNDSMTGPRILRPLLYVTGFRPDPVTAEDAWVRIESFFASHLA